MGGPEGAELPEAGLRFLGRRQDLSRPGDGDRARSLVLDQRVRAADPGLGGKTGRFVAVAWTEAEKAENLCRRGFLRPTPNGHAFEHADGTPFFMLGDTWWSTPTFRFRWTEDDTPHPMGPEATFKDMVKFRKGSGLQLHRHAGGMAQLGE